MGKIIVIASGKGGTGKTTAAANIGAVLAERGKLTAVVDMDMGLRNLDIVLGLESGIAYDVRDVIEGACEIDDALIRDARYENLYFLPSPQTRGAAGLDEDSVRRLWERMKSRFDYCIADAPAGLNGGFSYAAICADSAVIVTLPFLTALRDADRTASVLEDMGVTDIKVVINRVRPDMIDKGIMMNMDDCVDMLRLNPLGLVPDDEELMVSSLKGDLAVSNENSAAGAAFRNIAARIDGEETPIMDFEEKEGFLKRLKRLFGK